MTSYTPGPWDRTGLLIVSSKYKEAGSDKINLEIAAAGGRTDEEARANAKLIAAAPNLVNAVNVSVAVIKLLAPDANLSDRESEIVDFVLNYLMTLLKQVDGIDVDFQLEINKIVRLIKEESE